MASGGRWTLRNSKKQGLGPCCGLQGGKKFYSSLNGTKLWMKTAAFCLKGSLCVIFASLVAKEFACNVGDLGSIPGLGRFPGEWNSYPLQYYGLDNSRDCIVHGVAKNWICLSDFHEIYIIFMCKYCTNIYTSVL